MPLEHHSQPDELLLKHPHKELAGTLIRICDELLDCSDDPNNLATRIRQRSQS
jgi:hypothetical protein